LSNLSDIEIWSSFKKGEEWALLYIYSNNAEKLYRYGLKFASDSSLIEDSIQDLFSELLTKRRSIGDTNNILYYLFKCFRRKLMRKLQAEKRFEQISSFERQVFDVEWSIEYELISDEISSQRSAFLLKALKKLTPRQKEAVYLRFSRELAYKEIAGIMGISVEACRNLISKAIKRLKQSISTNDKNSVIWFLLFVH